MLWACAPPEPALPPPSALRFDGQRPRNVLMISIDTLRRDAIDPQRTPWLHALADAGVRLVDHVQCSDWTYPSTSCTLLGQLPEDVDFVPQLSEEGRAPLPADWRTLAVRLSDRGYATALISRNLWLSEVYGNTHGYDTVQWAALDTTTSMTMALSTLDTLPSPWLLHVHLMEPHAPYDPPEPYLAEADALPPLPDGIDLDTSSGHYDATDAWPELDPAAQSLLEQHLRARYAGEVRWLDDQLAASWDRLDAAGALDDTLVVIWTDHGEQFWERGSQSHAHDLGAEENDAFALFWARTLAPARWTGPTHAVDLVPTVLDALGLPVPEPGEDGLSGSPIGRAPPDRPRFASAAGRDGVRLSVIRDGWKLAVGFDGSARLFDRRSDPAERADLLPREPERAAALWALLEPRFEHLSELLPQTPAEPPALPR